MQGRMLDPTLSYWPLLNNLKSGKLVDLTHAFDQNSPHFESSVPLAVETVRSYEQCGFWVQRYQLEGQWGTHVDAPAHFCQGKRTIDQITLEEMLLPLVVIDIHEKVEKNPDYILTVDDVLLWEDQHGKIPMNAFVALRTDWSKRWPNQKAMLNKDEEGVPRSPGWSLSALQYLYEECEIMASGQETIDPDPGCCAKETNWACERYILNLDHYQVDLLTRLDLCPPIGAIVVCAVPKPLGGSGFPARIFAICPK